MGATASIRGRFVSAEHKSWDGFTGRDGPVASGERLNINVLADDGECTKIWTAREDIPGAMLACKGLSFGDRVEFAVLPGRNDSMRYLDRVLEVPKPVQPAAAPSSSPSGRG